MRNSVLPIMTVLTVVAGAIGLQIGESAISQIDPLYFEGKAEPPRDVSKEPRPQGPGGFAAASGWAEGYRARAADCSDCPVPDARGAHLVRAPQPIFDFADPATAPQWEQVSAPITTDELRIERSLEATSVQRYLHYPVSSDQAEALARLEGEQPASSEGPEEAEVPVGL